MGHRKLGMLHYLSIRFRVSLSEMQGAGRRLRADSGSVSASLPLALYLEMDLGGVFGGLSSLQEEVGGQKLIVTMVCNHSNSFEIRRFLVQHHFLVVLLFLKVAEGLFAFLVIVGDSSGQDLVDVFDRHCVQGSGKGGRLGGRFFSGF